jgi:hypothetical protein
MSRSNCAIGKDVVPASFKGVQFQCTVADIEGGRRGAEGEFPFGEDTAYADLGRKIRVYHLTAVFREDDHVGHASALFAACESPGPGILVHPTRGTQMVACRMVKVSDQLEEGQGESTAELEFVEANSTGSGLGGSLFGIITTGLNAASQAVFLRDYRPERISQPWRGDVIDTAQSLVNATQAVYKQTLPVDATAQQWRIALRMEEVGRDDGLAAVPAVVDAVETRGFNAIAYNIVDADIKFKAMRGLANIAAVHTKLPEVGGAAHAEEAAISRHRILAGVGMAESALGRKYSYVDQALATKDMVLEVLGSEAQNAYDNCDNELFLELRNYMTQFSKMMHDLAYRLPGLVIVNFAGGVHPLVAAYAIYNDAKRHRDLEPRNRIDANGRFMGLVSGIAPQ